MLENDKNEINPKPDIFAEKRKKALEYLGTKWVLHPNYVFDPRHYIETRHVTFSNQETKRSVSK